MAFTVAEGQSAAAGAPVQDSNQDLRHYPAQSAAFSHAGTAAAARPATLPLPSKALGESILAGALLTPLSDAL